MLAFILHSPFSAKSVWIFILNFPFSAERNGTLLKFYIRHSHHGLWCISFSILSWGHAYFHSPFVILVLTRLYFIIHTSFLPRSILALILHSPFSAEITRIFILHFQFLAESNGTLPSFSICHYHHGLCYFSFSIHHSQLRKDKCSFSICHSQRRVMALYFHSPFAILSMSISAEAEYELPHSSPIRYSIRNIIASKSRYPFSVRQPFILHSRLFSFHGALMIQDYLLLLCHKFLISVIIN